jgi:hypothetical protein
MGRELEQFSFQEEQNIAEVREEILLTLCCCRFKKMLVFFLWNT